MTGAPLRPHRRTIAIGPTISRTIRHMVYNALGLSCLAFSFLVLSVVLRFLSSYLEPLYSAQTDLGLGSTGGSLVFLGLVVMLFTNAVRLVLIGRSGPRNPFGFGWGWRETHVFLRALLFWAVPYGLTASIGLFPWNSAVPPLLFFVVIGVWAFVWSRMIPFVVAPAVEVRLTLKESWDATRGNSLHIIGCAVVGIMPIFVFLAVLHSIEFSGGSPSNGVVDFGYVGSSAIVAGLLIWQMFFTVLAAEIFDQLLKVESATVNALTPP